MRVIVVGAGIGGLSCAVDLARAGHSVRVVEKEPQAGGKMRETHVGGARIDAGPTVFTMKGVFESLFEDSGADLYDYVRVTPAETLARHFWPDGSRLDLYADVARTADAIGHAFGAEEARGYVRFCAYSRTLYETSRDIFITSQKPGLLDILKHTSRLGVVAVSRIDAHRTMWRASKDFFRDERLCQLFGRYATYAGSSPFRAPATLHVIAHVEREGVSVVCGGFYRLAEALERRAGELGVTFTFSRNVDRVLAPGGRVRGVLVDGDEWCADAVVLNADASALASGAFGEGPKVASGVDRVAERSLSAVTWALVQNVEHFELSHHNVFFSSDYEAEFAALFDRRVLPDEPTVYVCAQDQALGRSEGDEERLFVLVNAPASGDVGRPDDEEVNRCEKGTTCSLRHCGMKLDLSTAERTTPREFESRFPRTGGALYGGATHGMFGALSRPGGRTRLPGLYLAGGSVHPGAGVPMAALSGRMAARLIREDVDAHRLPCGPS